EIPSARMQELVANLTANLIERFQAVGREPGIDDGDRLHAFAREPLHRLVGVGLEPDLPAEARLERRDQPVLAPAQFLAQEPRRLEAMAIVRVALLDVALRQAVIGRDDD